MAPKPKYNTTYQDGFNDGVKEEENVMIIWLVFIAIAMFVVGLVSGIMWF